MTTSRRRGRSPGCTVLRALVWATLVAALVAGGSLSTAQATPTVPEAHPASDVAHVG